MPDWAKRIVAEEIDRILANPSGLKNHLIRPAPYEVMDMTIRYPSHVAIRHAVIDRIVSTLDRDIGEGGPHVASRTKVSGWFGASMDTVSRATRPEYAERRRVRTHKTARGAPNV